jgi:N-acetylmuramoyl-L-alanine amidase
MLGCVPRLNAQGASEQKQLTIYAAETTYSLPVVMRSGNEYIALLEALEPLGMASASRDGNKWKLRFNNAEMQLSTGKTKARIGRTEVESNAPFLAENRRVLAPVASLPGLLGAILPGRPVVLHAAARRLFLDNAEVRYSAALKKGPASQLQFSFSAPVDPLIATEAGKLHMVFRREPLIAGANPETVSFSDKAISSLAYSESNGWAELTVNSSLPLMAFFSADHKSITIAALPPLAPPQPSPGPVASTPAGSRTGTGAGLQPAKTPALPPPRGFLVVLDAAHGGDDHGGAITDELAEKDVDLAFARRLSLELQNRGMATRLIRDSDVTISPEERAAMANAAVPSLYLAIHAAGSGTGVHVFSSDVKPLEKLPVFLPWATAQAAFVSSSQTVARAVASELLKRDIPALDLSVGVSPLNEIAAPALAIEVAAPSGQGLEAIQSGAYQEGLCAAIAAGIAEVRSQLPHGEAAP